MQKNYPYFKVEPITDLRDMFEKSCLRFSKKPVLMWKEGNKYVSVSYKELHLDVEGFASGLIQLGLRQGDKVGILGENRPEWATTYLAVAGYGATCLPIDKDLRSQEIFHLLHFCDARFVVASEKYLDDLVRMKPRLPALQTIISMDDTTRKDVERFSTMLDKGRRSVKKGDKTFRRTRPEPDSLAAIIFSSGTMGNPKGVMLTHKNLATNIMQTAKSVHVDEKDRFLSVLPLHHTYECTAGFLLPLYRGSSVAYAENLRRVAENMAEVKATVMLGVPLLYDAFYNRLRAGIRDKGESRFQRGKKLANISEKMLGVNVRRRIFSAVHDKFGGKIRLFISGGAPLDPEIARGFRELGIHFIQGYGLTEASPLVAVNRDKLFKDGAVGFLMDQLQHKIVDGVLWVKGDNVMRAYYLNPEATAEVLQDGWLNTGDLASFDEDGFLYILGRKKALIVTPNGKNISPEEVERELMRSPYIQEVLVWGGTDPQNAEVQAVIFPNIEQLDIDFGSKGIILSREKIEEIIRKEITECCKNLAPYKRVVKFTLRDEEFAKTTTRKIKRYLYTESAKQVSAMDGQ